MKETNYERQLKREKNQVEQGIDRYRKAVSSAEATDMHPGQVLVKRAVEPVAEAITRLVADVEQGKAGRGRPAVAARYLQCLQPEAAAFITAKLVLNAAIRQDKLPRTATVLAAMINEHYENDELRAAEPNLARHMENKAKRWTTEHHRRTIMRVAAQAAGVTGLEWSQGDQLHLGMKLIDLFIETTGLVEQKLVSEGRNNTQYRLVPTAATAEWLSRHHDRCELLEPRFLPMVCPPKPWTSPLSGGYHSHECRQSFVTGLSSGLRDDLFSLDLSDVYRAVNSIQATPWRVNRAVFDVMVEAWSSGSQLAGLPSQDDLPVPARPADIPSDLPRDAMDDATRKRFDDWRGSAARAHDRNAARISKHLAVASMISLASDVKDEDAIYFPHHVDFRSRVYSMVPNLNPQGDDMAKALLQFADGKPLGESGAYWLHVQIANLFGVDKVSFDERVEWVSERHDLLLDSALNPLDGMRHWTTADDPWCALAACFEYAGWTISGDDYVSHLPIAMDGSCSGLQHFSAMLRDEEGGAAVNLLPSDKPADIYTKVAERVEDCLGSSELATHAQAQSWRGKVKRKVVKQPCMTFAYSVTSRGMRDQIIEAIKKLANGGDYLVGYENFASANFLAPLVEQSIRDTVKRAAEAMDWLKSVAGVVVEQGTPVTWFTPDGFPVAQRYVLTNGKRFKVWFGGRHIKVQLRVETVKQDKRKQKAGIAPNFVHSMDATHLRMVVNRLVDADVTRHFAMIHDSFGVHACDVDAMNLVIREEFIELYSVDRLEEFRKDVLATLPEEAHEEVGPVPEPGKLDLSALLEADFFFS